MAAMYYNQGYNLSQRVNMTMITQNTDMYFDIVRIKNCINIEYFYDGCQMEMDNRYKTFYNGTYWRL